MTTKINAVNMSTVNTATTTDDVVKVDKPDDNSLTVFGLEPLSQKPTGLEPKEILSLASAAGYDKNYETEIITKKGKTFVKVTVKKRQTVGILWEDYMPKSTHNDGTLKTNNPQYFDVIRCEDGNGRRISDLNYRMKVGDSLLIPIDKVKIKKSPVGWWRRNVMNGLY